MVSDPLTREERRDARAHARVMRAATAFVRAREALEIAMKAEPLALRAYMTAEERLEDTIRARARARGVLPEESSREAFIEMAEIRLAARAPRAARARPPVEPRRLLDAFADPTESSDDQTATS